MVEFSFTEMVQAVVWTALITNLCYVLHLLAHSLPHVCYDNEPDGDFDIRSIFCIHCLKEFFVIHFPLGKRRTFGLFLVPVALSFLVAAVVSAYFYNEFNSFNLKVAYVIITVAIGLSYDYTLLTPVMDICLPYLGGLMFFVGCAHYFFENYNVVLVMVLNGVLIMMLAAYLRWLYWWYALNQPLFQELKAKKTGRVVDCKPDPQEGIPKESKPVTKANV